MTQTGPVPSVAPTAAVASALAALPPSHRRTVQLARAGHSYRRISEVLGVPVEQVRVMALHAVLALTQARLAGSREPVTG